MTAPDPAPVPPVSPVEPQRPDTATESRDAMWCGALIGALSIDLVGDVLALFQSIRDGITPLPDGWLNHLPPAAPVPATPADERRAVDVRTLPEWDYAERLIDGWTADTLYHEGAAALRSLIEAARLSAAAPLSPPVPKPDDEGDQWVCFDAGDLCSPHDPHPGCRYVDRFPTTEPDATCGHYLEGLLDDLEGGKTYDAIATVEGWIAAAAPPAAPPRDERTTEWVCGVCNYTSCRGCFTARPTPVPPSVDETAEQGKQA